MAYLDPNELNALTDAGDASNLNDVRGALFPPVDMASVKNGIPQIPIPRAQLAMDLQQLNAITRLVSGIVPLEVWLTLAIPYVHDAGHKGLFEKKLDKVAQVAGGSPPPPIDPGAQEFQERIVLQDDMVSFRFLELGKTAGDSVGRIKVFPFENGNAVTVGGNQLPHLGTGWLVSEDLVITNHHIVNAREKPSPLHPAPLAGDQDLQKQTASAIIEFDYVSPNVQPTPTPIAKLEAADPELDFALVRLQNPSNKAPLALRQEDIEIKSLDDNFRVNIIQHPLGQEKKVGLRNNIVTKSTKTTLQYLTDTRRGSSGSPVLDDGWQVVALHRASTRVDKLKFQGKETGYVNVGTKIVRIIDYLKAKHPALAAEIQ